MRPSAARQWNPDAPDEVVLTDGKKRGFGDLLQAINPLHHIPVVGTIYREITGATIEPAARVIGGLVFGGPAGIASALVNAVIEDSSGKDIGGHIASLVRPAADPNAPPPPLGGHPAGPAEGAVFLASMGSAPQAMAAGTAESDGLLSTWIANGTPRGEPVLEARAPALATDLGRPLASHLPLFTPPVQVATAPEAAPAPAQAMAQAQAAPAGPDFLPLAGRGRSLAEYRAAAHAVPLGAMRTPVPSDPLAFQRNGPRTLANYRAEAPAAAELPAPLEAQRQADPAQAPSAEQSWVAAMMGAGLDRYRDIQRRRDARRPAQERL
ncbi:MAG: hypothetical protein ACKO1J_14370 [Tagaea sp.]